MINYTSLPLTTAERETAREFKRFGAVLMKVRLEAGRGLIVYALAHPQKMAGGDTLMITLPTWAAVTSTLSSVRAARLRAVQ